MHDSDMSKGWWQCWQAGEGADKKGVHHLSEVIPAAKAGVHLMTDARGAVVKPDNGIMQRLARLPIPHKGRFACKQGSVAHVQGRLGPPVP